MSEHPGVAQGDRRAHDGDRAAHQRNGDPQTDGPRRVDRGHGQHHEHGCQRDEQADAVERDPLGDVGIDVHQRPREPAGRTVVSRLRRIEPGGLDAGAGEHGRHEQHGRRPGWRRANR